MRGKDYATVQRGGGGLGEATDAAVGDRHRLRDRVPHPVARARAACRLAAPLLCHHLVVQPAARRPDPRPLRPGVRGEFHVRQEHAHLCVAGGIDRCGGRHHHRLSGAADAPDRTRLARLGRDRGARHSGRGLGHRIPAHLLRRTASRRHAARHPLDRDRAGSRHPAAALCAARLLRGPAADLRLAGGSGGKSRRHQDAHRPACGAAA